MEGPGSRLLLLHGTPSTPQVRDRIAEHLRQYGPVWAGRDPGQRSSRDVMELSYIDFEFCSNT
jgi:hypothetical protein